MSSLICQTARLDLSTIYFYLMLETALFDRFLSTFAFHHSVAQVIQKILTSKIHDKVEKSAMRQCPLTPTMPSPQKKCIWLEIAISQSEPLNTADTKRLVQQKAPATKLSCTQYQTLPGFLPKWRWKTLAKKKKRKTKKPNLLRPIEKKKYLTACIDALQRLIGERIPKTQAPVSSATTRN